MTDFVLRIGFHEAQQTIHDSAKRFKIVAAGRRFGKSHYAALVLAIEALRETNERGYTLTNEHGVYYVAPTFDQAKRIMWPKLRAILGFQRNGGLITNENVNDGWLELVNGRRIYIKGADNPDSLRGIGLSYVVLDEYADMKANVWDEIIDPALMDVEGGALFIGTPKGKNHFYRLFMMAMGTPDPRDAENYNPEAWDDWGAFHYKSLDNPYLAERELLRITRNKSKEIVRQEIEADFIAGGSKVLDTERLVYVDRPVVGAMQGNTYITVDLAGFKKVEGKISRLDETVVCVTFVNQTGWYVLEIAHGRWDIRRAASEIVLATKRWGGQLGIEKGALANAIGPYLEAYMREFNRFATPFPLSSGNQNKADRIYSALQGRIQRRMIYLCRSPDGSHKEWHDWLVDQMNDFPSPLSHDDGIDALAYVDQLASVSYAANVDIPDHEVMDVVSGY